MLFYVHITRIPRDPESRTNKTKNHQKESESIIKTQTATRAHNFFEFSNFRCDDERDIH